MYIKGKTVLTQKVMDNLSNELFTKIDKEISKAKLDFYLYADCHHYELREFSEEPFAVGLEDVAFNLESALMIDPIVFDEKYTFRANIPIRGYDELLMLYSTIMDSELQYSTNNLEIYATDSTVLFFNKREGVNKNTLVLKKAYEKDLSLDLMHELINDNSITDDVFFESALRDVVSEEIENEIMLGSLKIDELNPVLVKCLNL